MRHAHVLKLHLTMTGSAGQLSGLGVKFGGVLTQGWGTEGWVDLAEGVGRSSLGGG